MALWRIHAPRRLPPWKVTAPPLLWKRSGDVRFFLLFAQFLLFVSIFVSKFASNLHQNYPYIGINIFLVTCTCDLFFFSCNSDFHLIRFSIRLFIHRLRKDHIVRNSKSSSTSRPSAPVDFKIFTGDVFPKISTGVSYFLPGLNGKDIFAEVWKWPGCWNYDRGSPLV